MMTEDNELLLSFKKARDMESQLKDKVQPQLRQEEVRRLVTGLCCIFLVVLALLVRTPLHTSHISSLPPSCCDPPDPAIQLGVLGVGWCRRGVYEEASGSMEPQRRGRVGGGSGGMGHTQLLSDLPCRGQLVSV